MNFFYEKIKFRSKLFSTIIFISLFIGNYLIGADQKKAVSEYLFLQQFNDMCMIAPMINLKLLEKYLKISPTLENLPESAWLTRQQWFGEAHQYLYAWHNAFDGVNKKGGLIQFKKYLKEAIEHGPVTPHFYDKKNNFLFDKITGNQGYLNIPVLAKFAMTPYFFIDQNAMSALNIKVTDELIPMDGFYVPFVKTKDKKYRIYSQDKQIFEESIMPKPNKVGEFFYPDSTLSCVMNRPKIGNLGFDEIAYSYYPLGRGFINSEKAYFPYMIGLAKLIFLTLGIDNNNNQITEESSLYDVCKDIKNIVQLYKEHNPWSDEFFDKEKFLQYKLAEMFKKDPELFAQAKVVVDISPFKQWNIYETFIEKIKKQEIYKANKTPYEYEKVKDYLLGDEQALAYFFTQNIRFLWYGTLNEKAFYEYTVPVFSILENSFVPEFFSKNIAYSFTSYVENAFKKQEYSGSLISFIEVWNIIVEEFKKFNRKHWVSFDAHGWVVSFDDELIEMQKRAIEKFSEPEGKKKNRLYLLKSLGCAGIESSHSAFFNSFYKRQQKQSLPKNKLQKSVGVVNS